MKNNISAKEFVEVFNDLDKYPTIKDVANHFGIRVQTVKNRAHRLRAAWRNGSDVPQIIARGSVDRTHENPLSENMDLFAEDWGPEECIAELRRIAEIDPEKIVTRNYFRNHSTISESTWNRYFGTFEEFKRQAGIKLSRAQHKLEREIAVHASRDVYRRIGDERLGRGDKYTRDSGGRWKTILVGSDLHDIEVDPFWLRVFIDTARRVQPDVICLNGDVFDLAEFGRYDVDPRDWDIAGRISFVWEEIFHPLREACPNAQIDLIEGNHEARLVKLVSEATPAMKVVLSDLHGWSVANLLGLDKYEINYVAKADLAAFRKTDVQKELAKNWRMYYDCMIASHFPHSRTMGYPGWNGHHHRHQIWEAYSPMFGTYEWHQLGAGHKRAASYCEGERWSNGLLLANCDIVTKSTVMDYSAVTDFTVIGGDFYYRTEEEGADNPGVWPAK